ncbi:MAG: fumarylacetoacetase [Acidimicrobiia bacterium]
MARTSWVPVPEGSDFTLANLPFGVAGDRVHTAIGDHAVDLVAAADAGLIDIDPAVVTGPLNTLLARGPATWRAVRRRVGELLAADDNELRGHRRRDEIVVERASLDMAVPVAVGDYVDGYAGLHHATNAGRIFRPGAEPLHANWRHLPVMYHGRTSTIVPSGTTISRPSGQVLADGGPVLRPTAQLDFELELGAIIGVGNERGRPIRAAEAGDHIVGYVLVNDWSARDIQAFESVPLGPFLGKSFATSVSPWVVTVDALAPHLVAGLAARQEPSPPDHLRCDPRVPDLRFTVEVDGFRVCEVGLAEAVYWTPAQQLAHLTSNGAVARPGDLVASGTISGPDHRTQGGSLLERTWRGAEPFDLPGGGRRTFLEDGDTVMMRGWAGTDDERVGFGALTGTIA